MWQYNPESGQYTFVHHRSEQQNTNESSKHHNHKGVVFELLRNPACGNAPAKKAACNTPSSPPLTPSPTSPASTPKSPTQRSLKNEPHNVPPKLRRKDNDDKSISCQRERAPQSTRSRGYELDEHEVVTMSSTNTRSSPSTTVVEESPPFSPTPPTCVVNSKAKTQHTRWMKRRGSPKSSRHTRGAKTTITSMVSCLEEEFIKEREMRENPLAEPNFPGVISKNKEDSNAIDLSFNEQSLDSDKAEQECEATKKEQGTIAAARVPRPRKYATNIAEPTTMMMRNIPRRHSRDDLQLLLESSGFACGTEFDFFYLPFSLKTMRNLGYAFINFVSPEVAKQFMKKWHKKFPIEDEGSKSRPVNVSAALVQGRRANMDLVLCNNKAFKLMDPRLQPVVTGLDGARVDVSRFYFEHVRELRRKGTEY